MMRASLTKGCVSNMTFYFSFIDELEKLAKSQLQRVIEESYDDKWGNTRRMFSKRDPAELRKELVLIRNKKRQVVGFMAPQPGLKGGVRTGYMYITPEERKKGYGSKVLKKFGERPGSFSFVDKDNAPSQRAHEMAGWTRSGKHGKGNVDSDLWMPKERLKVAADMPFPSQYKRSLLRGTKNTTVRTSAEMGKYSPGMTYKAVSYKGRPIGVNIKVHSVNRVPASALAANTNARSAKATMRKTGVQPSELLEIIRFNVVQ